MSESVLYIGFSSPFRKAGAELPKASENDTLVGEDLHRLVRTQKGERIMRPQVGSTVMTHVFDNNDKLLEENLRTSLFTAVGQFEERIILLNVAGVREDSEVKMQVDYVVRATQQVGRDVLTIPTM
jgi:phage baseplate assembly protein W